MAMLLAYPGSGRFVLLLEEAAQVAGGDVVRGGGCRGAQVRVGQVSGLSRGELAAPALSPDK